MIEKTIGIFFDGISAIPQEIELIFDKEKSVFLFETINEFHIMYNCVL